MRFLLVDRLVRLDPGREVVVRKNVSNSEDFFSDHFAGRPVMPGCLLLESCDQAARLLLAAACDFTRLPALAGVTSAKFQHFVLPGDVLEIQAAVLAETADGAEVRASATVEGRRVAQAALAYRYHAAATEPAAARACARMREFYTLLCSDPLAAARAAGVVPPADQGARRG